MVVGVIGEQTSTGLNSTRLDSNPQKASSQPLKESSLHTQEQHPKEAYKGFKGINSKRNLNLTLL
jgi:hypothetical protein